MASNTVDLLVEQMNAVATSLAENPAPDYASYRERVGQYRGLKEALDITVNADNEDDVTHTF